MKHICLIADGAYFCRVLINILSNAVKYTQNGGTINFEIKELAGDNETAKYEFTIEDNGVGMSAEFAKRLFEPFVRGESSVTNKVQGTGLGMAIVKSIVALMNGDIQIESEPQKGTRIRVTLALERDRKAEKRREKNADGQANANSDAILSLDKMRFLCAEDNELNAEILIETLKMHNAECTLCKNGEELVNEFEKSAVGEYDAILTDIQMPIMNGLDAARAIRNSEKPDARKIPIVAMTANAFTEDIRRSIKAGMNAHIAKPIDIAALKKFSASFWAVITSLNATQRRRTKMNNKSNIKSKILIADDSELNREMLTDIIGDRYEYIYAADGEETLNVLSENADVDMLLLDMNMPKVSGMQVLKVMRERNWLEHIPVVIISAENDDNFYQKCVLSRRNRLHSQTV